MQLTFAKGLIFSMSRMYTSARAGKAAMIDAGCAPRMAALNLVTA